MRHLTRSPRQRALQALPQSKSTSKLRQSPGTPVPVRSPVRTPRAAAALCLVAIFLFAERGKADAPALPAAPVAAAELEVRLAPKLPFADAVRVLARGAGRTVVAEVPSLPAVVEGSPLPMPYPEALAQVSVAFDLYSRDRRRLLVLNRRFSDPAARVDLQVETLRLVSRDLLALYQGMAPYRLGEGRYGPEKERFTASLTPAQLVVMRTPDGLPFQALSTAQQANWLRVNAASVYCSILLEVERAARLFGGWEKCRVTPAGAAEPNVWMVDYSAASGKSEGAQLRFGLPRPPARARAVSPRAAGEKLAETVLRLPGPLNRLAPALDGEIVLAFLAESLSRASRTEIRLPRWAESQRVLVVTAPGATVGEVLQGLADLHGWDLNEAAPNAWTLDRPTIRHTRNPRDVHQQARAAIGPVLQLYLSAEEAQMGLGLLRSRALFQRLQPDLLQRRAGFLVTDLAPEQQRLLAEVVVRTLVARAVGELASRPEPPWWLAEPEKGRFRLEGEGDSLSLQFEVLRPDGKTSTWGWAIGTAKKDVRP